MSIKTLWKMAAVGLLAVGSLAHAAEEYVIDTKGAHASINFKVAHLGYSWLQGRFNQFGGNFTYDADKPENSAVNVTIETGSVDSNHAERDKHLRSSDFLNVDKHPKAMFTSKTYTPTGDNTATLTGDFTLNGVTKELTLDVEHIGAGTDPWGGFRRGFMATAEFKMKDFGINYNLGPASETVYLTLHIEGIRK